MPEKSSSKATKPAAKKAPAGSKRSSQKRELIAPNGDKRYVKRDSKGQFKESDDVGRSLSQDVRKSAKTKVKSGYGDQGDQASKPSSSKSGASKSDSKSSGKASTKASKKS
jgi:hypothetical protein